MILEGDSAILYQHITYNIVELLPYLRGIHSVIAIFYLFMDILGSSFVLISLNFDEQIPQGALCPDGSVIVVIKRPKGMNMEYCPKYMLSLQMFLFRSII